MYLSVTILASLQLEQTYEMSVKITCVNHALNGTSPYLKANHLSNSVEVF